MISSLQKRALDSQRDLTTSRQRVLDSERDLTTSQLDLLASQRLLSRGLALLDDDCQLVQAIYCDAAELLRNTSLLKDARDKAVLVSSPSSWTQPSANRSPILLI